MHSKMKSRKSWREKLENEVHSKVLDIPPSMAKRFGNGTMLIPKPLDVDALIRKTRRDNSSRSPKSALGSRATITSTPPAR
jgi:hypothetical protein